MLTFQNLGYQGRLGNQLFQIAATIGIARDLGSDFTFREDWLYRPYFSLPESCFAPTYVTEMVPESFETEKTAHMDPRCRSYLQDVNLFLHHIDEIREYFRPSDYAKSVLVPNICSHPHMGVHVRRGDNVIDPGVPNKYDYYVVPSRNYYLRGMETVGWQTFWVFSDDVAWCREMLPPAERYGNGAPYVKEHEPTYGTYAPSDWIDLFTLAQCDAFVLSNSTFGIWGALLSHWALQYPENVVRPDQVYGPLLKYIDQNLMFHPKWRVLSCF